MKNYVLYVLLFTLFPYINCISQTTDGQKGMSVDDQQVLNGIVLDQGNNSPLLYTTVYVLNTNRGTVSNEAGHFSLSLAGLKTTDTLRFQYVGYKTRNLTLGQLLNDPLVYLTEEVINLGEFLVFAVQPDPEAIVKKVLKNKKSNYLQTTAKRQMFIRVRDITDIENFKLNYKKSSIPDLDRKTFEQASKKVPKNTTSYDDFLGYLYFNKDERDASTFKVDPIRMVTLKEEGISKPGQVAKVLEKALADTKENEYWKVKTGVISQKIDNEKIKPINASDSLGENVMRLSAYSTSLKEQLEFSLMEHKDEWEFLYSTSKYNFTIGGGTRVNGEDVYIIDFTPKKNGLYQGKLFIAMKTYALIRADFEYAPNKIGNDVNFLGMGYTEKDFSGSIFFEKKEDNYVLKYFSRKKGYNIRLDRNFALIKKKESFMFDKKLDEIKIGVAMKANREESLELLVLDMQKISEQQYIDFKQPEYIKPIYVKQFDDALWEGFDIIEPTSQMKDYKKQGEN